MNNLANGQHTITNVIEPVIFLKYIIFDFLNEYFLLRYKNNDFPKINMFK